MEVVRDEGVDADAQVVLDVDVAHVRVGPVFGQGGGTTELQKKAGKG